MMKKLFSTLTTLALAATLATSAFATDIGESGGSQTVPVPLTAEAATFSVTLPTALPIQVSANGLVTTANEAKIVNQSHGAVKVTDLSITGANGWKTVDYDSANMATEKVGAHKVAFKLNNQQTVGADALSPFTPINFHRLDGANSGVTDELAIDYDAKVPAQSTVQDNLVVANVVFTIGWDTASN